MEDTDPDTELARQLHREWNGLNRTKPRSFRPPDPLGRQRSQSRKPSPSGTQNDSSGNKRNHQEYSPSGEDQRQQQRQEQRPSASAPQQEQHRPQQQEHPKLKRLRKGGDHGGKERSSQPQQEPQAPAHTQQQQQRQQALQQQQQQLAPRSSAHCDMRPSAREGNGTERAGSGGVANGGGGGGARFEAAASSAAVDACTKAQYVDAEPQPSRVKCFYAGVRWGLALPPEALASRHALAASLTAAFSQDGVHCGRGDHLHVVFLDKDGMASEFPPHAQAGWSTAAKYACRVFVRLR